MTDEEREIWLAIRKEAGLKIDPAQLGYGPVVWALGSAGAIERREPIEGAAELVVAADHDPVGLQAGGLALRRWLDAGRQARGILVAEGGWDFADLAREVGR